MRQGRPQRLGHERHDRVEQAQVRVERLDERPPGRLADLVGGASSSARRTLASSTPQSQNSLQIASYRSAGHLAEGEVGHRAVDLGDRRRGARPDPALGRPEVPLVGQGSLGVGGRSPAGRAPTTKRVAFHSLLAKLRAFSSLAAPKRWSCPGVAPWMSGEAQGVGAGLVDDPQRVDDVALRLATSSGRTGRG